MTLLILFAAAVGGGAAPPADPELIPLRPTPKVAPAPPGIPVHSFESMTFTRTSMYDRWQYMAVDQSGHFRPRVVLDFPSAYYLGDGKPYPWLGLRSRDVIPYIFD
jgi:hypothetical protein